MTARAPSGNCGAIGQPTKNCQVQIIVFQFSHIRDSSQEASLFEVDKIRPCCDT